MRAFICASLVLVAAMRDAAAVDPIANCQREVQGTKIRMTATIGVLRKDLLPRLNEVDIAKYCQCVHRTLREELGDALYARSQDVKSELTTPELMKQYETSTKAEIRCVEEQVGNTPETTLTGSPQELYRRFMRATVRSRNVGGLRLGDGKDALFKVLGPTKTFERTADGGERFFYGSNANEVVVSISPAPHRTVRQIALNYRFEGQTPGGGRMGDRREKIKRTYPGKLAADFPQYAVYCDGTAFLFSATGGHLLEIRLSELESDPFKNDRLRNCS